MIRARLRLVALSMAVLAVIAPTSDLAAQDREGDAPLILAVEAGRFDRRGTPIRLEIPEARLAPAVRDGLARGPVAVSVAPVDRGEGEGATAQVERVEGGKARLTWILKSPVAAGRLARFAVGPGPMAAPDPWAFSEPKPGTLDLKLRARPVFRYNGSPVASPDYGPIQVRDAYLHPAYSPSGALITGDFSRSHPHHRGFFLAYVHTEAGGSTPDFWNIHLGTGKIVADGLAGGPTASAVTARFSAKHRWEARDRTTNEGRVVLRETWDVEAYDIPGAPYILFDLTSTQQAVGRPLNVLPYRYGGMAYRGPEPFVKGTLDVLTSEGLHRRDGDGKAARWVDLTGPVADGSSTYAGAMIADHPGNPGSPTKVRIHPILLPFFSYVPARDRALTIPVEAPVVFRYRILLHDGHPDPVVDERLARDFSEPPAVRAE